MASSRKLSLHPLPLLLCACLVPTWAARVGPTLPGQESAAVLSATAAQASLRGHEAVAKPTLAAESSGGATNGNKAQSGLQSTSSESSHGGLLVPLRTQPLILLPTQRHELGAFTADESQMPALEHQDSSLPQKLEPFLARSSESSPRATNTKDSGEAEAEASALFGTEKLSTAQLAKATGVETGEHRGFFVKDDSYWDAWLEDPQQAVPQFPSRSKAEAAAAVDTEKLSTAELAAATGVKTDEPTVFFVKDDSSLDTWLEDPLQEQEVPQSASGSTTEAAAFIDTERLTTAQLAAATSVGTEEPRAFFMKDDPSWDTWSDDSYWDAWFNVPQQ